MGFQSVSSRLNRLSNEIIGLAIQVHKILGPGLLESVYKECLFHEIAAAGYFVEKEKSLPVVYKTIRLDVGYRIDLLIENELIIEIKSVDTLADIHISQLLTYLKLYNSQLGLLINFNVVLLKNGIKRLVV